MIAICTPTRDLVQGTFVCDLIQLVKNTPDLVFAMAFGTMVGNLRSSMVRASLTNNASHILFIDSDMRFPPDTADRLLKADKDIIGANCHQRSQDQTTARKDGEFISSDKQTGIEEIDTLGFGVTLIKSEVFLKLEEPWFATPWDKSEKKSIGEDVYFCTVAKEAGFKVWVDHDLSKEVRHIGSIELEVM